MNEFFRRFSHAASNVVGSSWAFLIAVIVIATWAVSGPIFNFSDTWQLIINTGTTIITFLMVFLIQNTQNRDAKAIHLKLDELLKAVEGARNNLIDLEDMADEELEELQQEFQRVRKKYDLDNQNDKDEVKIKKKPKREARVKKQHNNSGTKETIKTT
ncbi:MAG: low affinity iron permease family protein [Anaerolineales bacterium]|nr:low affinity iron permease family protein [Anaerolineales bacterium]